MKKRLGILLAMLPMLVFFACSKGGKDMHFGIISDTTIRLSADDTQAEIDIEANVDWTVTGGKDWCMPDVVRGNGDRKVKLTIKPNTTSSSRNITLKVGSFLGVADVYVEQAGVTTGYAEGAYKAAETNRQTDPVNIVIMGDGFTAADLEQGGAYDQAMDRAREAFFDIEPFKSYRSYFNVYYVYAESEDRGATYGWGYDGSTKATFAFTVRNTAFKATFSTSANSTATSCNYQKVFDYARKIPAIKVGADIVLKPDGNILSGAISDVNNVINKTLIILVINDTRYAGTCVMYPTGAAIGMCPMSTAVGNMSFEATLRHEAGGHGFGKFTDEYIYYPGAIPQTDASGYSVNEIQQWQGLGFYKNMSTVKTKAGAPEEWQPFLDNAAVYPEVGFFEGGCTYALGIWRAESNSIMNDNVPYFNGPQRYFIYNRIKKIAGEAPSWADFRTRDVQATPSQLNAFAAMAKASESEFIPLGRPIMMDMPL